MSMPLLSILSPLSTGWFFTPNLSDTKPVTGQESLLLFAPKLLLTTLLTLVTVYSSKTMFLLVFLLLSALDASIFFSLSNSSFWFSRLEAGVAAIFLAAFSFSIAFEITEFRLANAAFDFSSSDLSSPSLVLRSFTIKSCFSRSASRLLFSILTIFIRFCCAIFFSKSVL